VSRKKCFKYIHNIRILSYLLMRDAIVLKKTLIANIINSIIWPVSIALSYGYVVSTIGLDPRVTVFILVGSVFVIMFYSIYEYAFVLVHDIDGNRDINFELSLPLSTDLIIIRYALAFVLNTFFLVIPIIFVIKLTLYKYFDMAQFDSGRFVMITLMSLLVLSFQMLLMVGLVSRERFRTVRIRFFEPLMYLGGMFFSWHMLYSVSPRLSYLALINPATYMMDGFRCSIFGQEGYLNFWLCMSMLVVHLVIFIAAALHTLKKRLDYVPC